MLEKRKWGWYILIFIYSEITKIQIKHITWAKYLFKYRKRPGKNFQKDIFVNDLLAIANCIPAFTTRHSVILYCMEGDIFWPYHRPMSSNWNFVICFELFSYHFDLLLVGTCALWIAFSSISLIFTTFVGPYTGVGYGWRVFFVTISNVWQYEKIML